MSFPPFHRASEVGKHFRVAQTRSKAFQQCFCLMHTFRIVNNGYYLFKIQREAFNYLKHTTKHQTGKRCHFTNKHTHVLVHILRGLFLTLSMGVGHLAGGLRREAQQFPEQQGKLGFYRQRWADTEKQMQRMERQFGTHKHRGLSLSARHTWRR